PRVSSLGMTLLLNSSTPSQTCPFDMDPDNVIDIQNLSHRYKTHQALSGVSFTVRRQSIHGFVGPNGAGKTTTLKVLATLLKPQGSARFPSRPMAQPGDARFTSVHVFGQDIVTQRNNVRRR